MWIRFLDKMMITDYFSAFFAVLRKILIKSVPLFTILWIVYAMMTSLFLVLGHDANYLSNKQDIVNEVFGNRYIDMLINVVQISFT
jgi:hypothetical protein